jgi:hypothetical protein
VSYLVCIPKHNTHILFMFDPREDGYTGELVEDVRYEEPSDLHAWPPGSDRPSPPAMGRSPVDPKHYKCFKNMDELNAEGFEHVGAPATMKDRWSSYLKEQERNRAALGHQPRAGS